MNKNSQYHQNSISIIKFLALLIYQNLTKQFFLLLILFLIGISFFSNINAQQNEVFDAYTNMYYNVSSTKNYNFANQNPLPTLFNWQMVQSPTIQLITNIYFVDSLHGYATHFEGAMKTVNGGLNWQEIFFASGASISGVHFINKDTGWICGQMKRIRKTVDGGQNWIIQDYPQFALPFYYDVIFLNNNTGYVVGSESASKGYIVKTTNSGVNWQQIFLSVQTNSTIYGQFWFNEDTAWFFGSSIFMKTTNGGLSFIDFYPTIPPTSNGFNGLLGLCFINSNTGWLSGSNVDNKNMYKTTNGGMNWFFQDNPVTQFQFAQLDDVVFIDENRGWAGGYSGQLITTTNGGNNWITDISAPTWFVCFDNYGSSKLWCGAKWGEIWYLDDIPPVSIQSNGTEIPKEIVLKQNYPNPFNPFTTIKYEIPKDAEITIKVYDLLGREVFSFNEYKKAGSYEVKFDGSNLASGMYLYSFEVIDPSTGTRRIYLETKKMVLIK